MGVLKTSGHIRIIIKMQNPSQEPPASSKAPNEDLKDKNVLCTFKIKIESQNLDHGCIKDQWPYPNQDQDAKPQSGAPHILQSPKWGLKGHGCSSHNQNQDREPKFRKWTTKNQWPYANQDQDVRSQSGKIWNRGLPKTSDHIQTKSGCQTLDRNLQCPPKPQMRIKRTWMFFAPSKLR